MAVPFSYPLNMLRANNIKSNMVSRLRDMILETLKMRSGRALSDLVQLKMSLITAGVLAYTKLKGE